MSSRLLAAFARGPDAPRIEDPGQVDALYRRLRWTVMVTLTLGYAFSYTCRLGLSVVRKPLLDEGIFTAVEIGLIGAAFKWGYGFGKLGNGFLADRVNARTFLATGLAVSAVINLVMGSNTALALAIGLWVLNGWFQGFGAPTSVASIRQWFSHRETGTMYGIWSTAHSIGEGLTFIGTGALVVWTSWQAAFWGPGIACLFVAGVMFFTLRDRPQTLGLPPVADWRGEKIDAVVEARGSASVGGAQWAVLANPKIWIIGLSSALIYVSRYAINDWGMLYLQEAHGFDAIAAGSLIGINTVVGIGGSIAYGWVSDRYFTARRPPLTLIFGVLEVAGLVLLFASPRGSVLLLGAGMVLYGFTLSGLLAVLGGLFAVDIASPKAAGTAMGFVGVFSYIGAGLQDPISGWLIERGSTLVNGVRHYDFTAPILFWVGASVLSMLLAASLWSVRPHRED